MENVRFNQIYDTLVLPPEANFPKAPEPARPWWARINWRRVASITGFLLALLLFTNMAYCQQTQPVSVQPDCITYVNSSVSASSGSFDNRTKGCILWTLRYAFPPTISALSIAIQGAPDNNGVPGAWSTITTTLQGSNPGATGINTIVVSGYFPWVRATILSSTGTGTIYARLGGEVVRNTNVQGVASTGGLVSRINPMLIGGQDVFGTLDVYGVLNGSFPTMLIYTGADGYSNASLGTGVGSYSALMPVAANYGFNGTSWDRRRNASLANFPVSTTLTGRNLAGASIGEKGGRWSVRSAPAIDVQASASIAAEASVRHTVDCIAFSAVATTAPAATALTINLRDGATGAGTIIWSYQVFAPAAVGTAVVPFSLCGLNLTGTTNTAMTLEFSAGLTNLIQTVSMSGYNVN